MPNSRHTLAGTLYECAFKIVATRILASECNMTYRPFISALIIIVALLAFTIGKMEQRRMGYLTLKLSHQYRLLLDERRELTLRIAQATRPERIERWALSENKQGYGSGRIIAISGGRVVLQQ